jgi:dTDP-4-amino-4,6-dideoxygalactose transaminase
MVPLLDLKIQNTALAAELKAAFDRVLGSNQFILGTEVESFESQLATLTQARHAIGVSSGTDALLLALMALEIGPGDEVICPSFTFFATAGCVARVGARPVFVDSCPVCFNLDLKHAASKISGRTKALIPVHLFGQTAAMDGVLDLARRHDLAVIEDAAQSMGATYFERPAGTMGTFGAFSFFPSKNLGGFGDAGLLVTQDEGLAEKARLLRTHGAQPKYFHKWIGGNFRLDALQAALLSVKIPHYSNYCQARRENAAYYSARLGRVPGFQISSPAESCCLKHAGGSGSTTSSAALVSLPAVYPENVPIWNQYTLRVHGEGRRDQLRQFLADHGIGTEVYYPVPLHQQSCFASLKTGKLPQAEKLAREVLSIPIYPELTREQQDEVISAMIAWAAGS